MAQVIHEEQIDVAKARKLSKKTNMRLKVWIIIFGLIVSVAGIGITLEAIDLFVFWTDLIPGFIILLSGIGVLSFARKLFRPREEEIWEMVQIKSDVLSLKPTSKNPNGQLDIRLNSILFAQIRGGTLTLFLESNKKAKKYWEEYQEKSGFEKLLDKKDMYDVDADDGDVSITGLNEKVPFLRKMSDVRGTEIKFVS